MQSPVFRAQLYGPMKEARIRHMTIQEIHPAVFGALLHFIYTDSLLDMGDREEDCPIVRLKLICQSLLCDSIGVETVAATLALADQCKL
jgi:speckle-type POZ protein